MQRARRNTIPSFMPPSVNRHCVNDQPENSRQVAIPLQFFSDFKILIFRGVQKSLA